MSLSNGEYWYSKLETCDVLVLMLHLLLNLVSISLDSLRHLIDGINLNSKKTALCVRDWSKLCKLLCKAKV